MSQTHISLLGLRVLALTTPDSAREREGLVEIDTGASWITVRYPDGAADERNRIDVVVLDTYDYDKRVKAAVQ